jgi:hypothetical protein
LQHGQVLLTQLNVYPASLQINNRFHSSTTTLLNIISGCQTLKNRKHQKGGVCVEQTGQSLEQMFSFKKSFLKWEGLIKIPMQQFRSQALTLKHITLNEYQFDLTILSLIKYF